MNVLGLLRGLWRGIIVRSSGWLWSSHPRSVPSMEDVILTVVKMEPSSPSLRSLYTVAPPRPWGHMQLGMDFIQLAWRSGCTIKWGSRDLPFLAPSVRDSTSTAVMSVCKQIQLNSQRCSCLAQRTVFSNTSYSQVCPSCLLALWNYHCSEHHSCFNLRIPVTIPLLTAYSIHYLLKCLYGKDLQNRNNEVRAHSDLSHACRHMCWIIITSQRQSLHFPGVLSPFQSLVT